MDFVIYYLNVLFLSVGVFVVCGLIVGLFKKAFCAMTGRAGHGLVIATSIIGTPIHELGHALMCLIFGHHINKMVLWQPRDPKGVLGYVSHSYNKKNLWHVLGNLFIGLGPIFSGLLVTLLMMFIGFGDAIGIYLDASADSVASGDGFFEILLNSRYIIPDMFSSDGEIWLKVIAAIVILSVCLHINLSGADVKSSLSSLPIYMLISLIFVTVTWFIGEDCVLAVTSALSVWSLTVAALYMIVFISSLVLLAVAFVFFLIRKLIGRD